MEQHFSMKPAYMAMVRKLEKQGATTSDAQGMADVKFDPHFAKKKEKVAKKINNDTVLGSKSYKYIRKYGKAIGFERV